MFLRPSGHAPCLRHQEFSHSLRSHLFWGLCFHVLQINHSLTFRNRKALLMTETELRLIAAPAMIGLSSKPKNG